MAFNHFQKFNYLTKEFIELVKTNDGDIWLTSNEIKLLHLKYDEETSCIVQKPFIELITHRYP